MISGLDRQSSHVLIVLLRRPGLGIETISFAERSAFGQEGCGLKPDRSIEGRCLGTSCEHEKRGDPEVVDRVQAITMLA